MLGCRGRNTYIDCHFDAELRRTAEILKETSGPAYRADFENTWTGKQIQPGRVISLAEDTWRTYGEYTAVKILNSSVVKSRGGMNLTDDAKENGIYVSHSTWKRQGNYQIMPDVSGAVFNKVAFDTRYAKGLLLRDGIQNVTGDFIILPSPAPLLDEPKTRAIAKIGGKNHDLTFRRATEDLQLNGSRRIIVGEWESHASGAENVRIVNRTGLPVMLNEGAKNCTVITNGEVTDNGKNNKIRYVD